MGFINEMVSKDDKMEFYIPDYKSVTPSSWTIDRAKLDRSQRNNKNQQFQCVFERYSNKNVKKEFVI